MAEARSGRLSAHALARRVVVRLAPVTRVCADLRPSRFAYHPSGGWMGIAGRGEGYCEGLGDALALAEAVGVALAAAVAVGVGVGVGVGVSMPPLPARTP